MKPAQLAPDLYRFEDTRNVCVVVRDGFVPSGDPAKDHDLHHPGKPKARASRG